MLLVVLLLLLAVFLVRRRRAAWNRLVPGDAAHPVAAGDGVHISLVHNVLYASSDDTQAKPSRQEPGLENENYDGFAANIFATSGDDAFSPAAAADGKALDYYQPLTSAPPPSLYAQLSESDVDRDGYAHVSSAAEPAYATAEDVQALSPGYTYTLGHQGGGSTRFNPLFDGYAEVGLSPAVPAPGTDTNAYLDVCDKELSVPGTTDVDEERDAPVLEVASAKNMQAGVPVPVPVKSIDGYLDVAPLMEL